MENLLPNTNHTGNGQAQQRLIAGLYARVSTGRQEQEETIDSQVAEIKARVKQDGNILPEENVLVDDGWTGSMIERPGLDSVRDAAHEGRFQVLYVYDRGRLSRVFYHQELVIDELRSKGIQFISLHDINAMTPEEQVLQSMQGVFHQYERIKIAERFRRGKLYKAKNGILINGQAKYGYRYIKRTDTEHARYEVNEEEARVVRMVWHWYGNERISINQVRKRLYDLGIPPKKRKSQFWTKGPIRRLLNCDTYVSGHVYYNKTEAVVPTKPRSNDKYKKVKKSSRKRKPREEWLPYQVPPLIDDPTLFDRIQERLRFNKRYARKNRKYDYLLTGKIYCSCGNRRGGDGSGKNGHFYYRCSERIHKIKREDRTCFAKGVSATVLDKMIWNELVKYLTRPELIKKHAQKWITTQVKRDENQQERENLEGILESIRAEEDRYSKAYGAGALEFDHFTELMKKTKGRKKGVEKQIAELKEKVSIKRIKIDVDELCKEAANVLKSLDLSDKKRVVQDIIDKVVIQERRQVGVWAHIPLKTLPATEKMGYELISRHSRPSQRWQVHTF